MINTTELGRWGPRHLSMRACMHYKGRSNPHTKRLATAICFKVIGPGTKTGATARVTGRRHPHGPQGVTLRSPLSAFTYPGHTATQVSCQAAPNALEQRGCCLRLMKWAAINLTKDSSVSRVSHRCVHSWLRKELQFQDRSSLHRGAVLISEIRDHVAAHCSNGAPRSHNGSPGSGVVCPGRLEPASTF